MTITNTMENARRLERLGFSHEQSQGLSEILEDNARTSQPDLSDLATKGDLQSLDTRFDARLKDLELRIAEKLRSQMVWFFAIQISLFSLAFALLKFFE